MTISTEIGSSPGKRSGREGAEQSACGARNLIAPFPCARSIGTDPRRQGYVGKEVFQERENFFHHRCAPLTAPVPFRKKLDIRERGQKQRPGSRLAPTLMSGQTAASKARGLCPCDPARKNMKFSLDGRGPSHGSRDREGAVAHGYVPGT